MALSASKSTSQRGATLSSSSSSKEEKIPIRRSRSVSAVSRTNGSAPSSSSSSSSREVSVSDEFLNKRDNPLYSYPSSSSDSSSPGSGSAPCGSVRRGRSVSRRSGVGNEGSGSVRSLPRVDSGRRRLRSLSKDHHVNSETGGHGYKPASSLLSKEDGNSFSSKVQRESTIVTTEFVEKEETKNLRTWTSKHPISQSWDASSSCSQARNWEDGISTSSFSEAEEASFSARDHLMTGSGAIYETVGPEVRFAVSDFRNDLEDALTEECPIMTKENIGVVPPNSVNQHFLVSDIRKEYTSKLEQSQERARKLRADLAVEEQREKELSSILRQIMLVARKYDSQTPCPRRKASVERIRMSRCLAEEAMNYFDECVSISTFDSSDISALEDSHPSTVIDISQGGSGRYLHNEDSNLSVPNFRFGHANHNEELKNQTQSSMNLSESDIAINRSCSDRKDGNLLKASVNHDDVQFSFAHDTVKAVGVHGLRQYVNKFGKGATTQESSKHVRVNSSYNPDDPALSKTAESLIFDNLILRNRIESGGLLLCNIRIF